MSAQPPEVLIARRLISRRGIRPPILVDDIAREYADVEEISLPFDFDGISMFLKHRFRRPKIFLNANRPERRRRFTLAHELGHVVIPWHVGTIVDSTDPERSESHDRYATLEAEANRFASEFLMPMPWVLEVIADFVEPAEAMREIVEVARVSHAAAAIKTIQSLPPGSLYAHVLEDGTVVSSGRSEGTIASPPAWRSTINPESAYLDCASFRSVASSSGRYYWWTLHRSIDVDLSAPIEDWRAQLDKLLDEIGFPEGKERKKYKASLNGVIAYANSRVRGADRSVETVYAACLQRFSSNPQFAQFRAHPLFKSFLRNRVADWFL